MMESLSLEGSDRAPLETLQGILLSANVSRLRFLLQSSPSGILVTGSDHTTRRAVVEAAAPEALFVSASLYVLGVAKKNKFPACGVLCVEDVDIEGGKVDGALKGLFTGIKVGQTVIGLAATQARLSSALLRADRFETIHRITAPSIQTRQEAWKRVLHKMLQLDSQFEFPREAAEHLAMISPGYGYPDIRNILYAHVARCMPVVTSTPDAEWSSLSFEGLKGEIAAHEPMRGSADLDFVTSSHHSPAFEPHLAMNWGDHAGYETVKETLIHLCEWPVSHAETFRRLGITPPRGVLLHGPHGCGKTLIATRFLQRLRYANWLQVHAPDLFSKYLGDSEARVRSLFERARQLTPCVVFIDELDAIGGSRDRDDDGGSGVERRVLGALLTELDGVSGGQVFLLGCASDVSLLDVALVRPGRIDNLIEIGLPDQNDRRAILQSLLRGVPVDGELADIVEDLVDVTEGLSGAHLAGFCREAGMIAIEEEAETRVVARRHFEQAIAELKQRGCA